MEKVKGDENSTAYDDHLVRRDKQLREALGMGPPQPLQRPGTAFVAQRTNSLNMRRSRFLYRPSYWRRHPLPRPKGCLVHSRLMIAPTT